MQHIPPQRNYGEVVKGMSQITQMPSALIVGVRAVPTVKLKFSEGDLCIAPNLSFWFGLGFRADKTVLVFKARKCARWRITDL